MGHVQWIFQRFWLSPNWCRCRLDPSYAAIVSGARSSHHFQVRRVGHVVNPMPKPIPKTSAFFTGYSNISKNKLAQKEAAYMAYGVHLMTYEIFDSMDDDTSMGEKYTYKKHDMEPLSSWTALYNYLTGERAQFGPTIDHFGGPESSRVEITCDTSTESESFVLESFNFSVDPSINFLMHKSEVIIAASTLS